MANGVLVFGEALEDGRLNPVTAELIAAGTRLGGPVTCALLGAGVEGLAQECVAAGADKVFAVSGATGAGIPELLDAVLGYLPDRTSTETKAVEIENEGEAADWSPL